MFRFEGVKNYTIEGWYPKWGNAKFKVLLQDGDYYGEIVVYRGGNMQGVSLISGVANSLDDLDYEEIDMSVPENKRHAVVDDEGYLIGFRLYNDSGGEMFIDGTYDMEHFKHVIVGIVMVDYTLENKF